MTTEALTIRMMRLHPDQSRVQREAKRFNVVNCGRRWGKTILGIDLVCRIALNGWAVGWFSPEYKLMGDAWRDLKSTLAPVILRSNDTEKRIELITGGVIDAWSFDRNPNAGRSRRYKRVVIDEAAHCANLEEVWTKAVRPTLTDYRGDAWFLSSPNGQNYFHKLYQRAEKGEPGWGSWTFESYGNPKLNRAEIDAARTELPDWVFAQEYLAKFHSQAHDVLLPEFWISRMADPGIVQTVERLRTGGQGGMRRLAVDLGYGTGADRTVLLVRDDLGVLDLVVSSGIGVPEAASRIAELSRKWAVHADRIVYDAGGPGRDLSRYLEQHRIEAVPYHGSGTGGAKFANKRTKSAWRMRQRLDPERPEPIGPDEPGSIWKAPRLAEARAQRPFSIPGHWLTASAREELQQIRFEMKGEKEKIALELKEELMKRLGRSPDIADALIMSFATGDS